MSGLGQAEEDKAEKARAEAAKDEESPQEVLIGDSDTAVNNHSTLQHELVRGYHTAYPYPQSFCDADSKPPRP